MAFAAGTGLLQGVDNFQLQVVRGGQAFPRANESTRARKSRLDAPSKAHRAHGRAEGQPRKSFLR